MAKSGLTTKQRMFVEAYLANGFNATQAAITAGYSRKTAYSQGSRLLRNVEVEAAVQERMKALAMSADEAMFRLSQQGRGSLPDFLGLSVSELKAHPQAQLLHKVKVTTRIIPIKDKESEREETIELEIYNAQSALQAILKEQHLRAGEATEIIPFGLSAEVVALMEKLGIDQSAVVAEFEQMIREQAALATHD